MYLCRLKAVSVDRERVLSGLVAPVDGEEQREQQVEQSEESDVGGSDMEEAGTDATAARQASRKRQHVSYQEAGGSDQEAVGLPCEEDSERGEGGEDGVGEGLVHGSGSMDSEEEEAEGGGEGVREVVETAALDQERVNVSFCVLRSEPSVLNSSPGSH